VGLGAFVALLLGLIALMRIWSDSWSRAASDALKIIVVVAAVWMVVDWAHAAWKRVRQAPSAADVIWPYLPRRGFASVPAWLLVVLLIVGVGLLLAFLGLIGG
jgi:hypothetical protein